ncbi:MAG TPA: DUF4124 domain-containing protein [Gammaproteobacteria bacterium]|nr:DUF4124 domain-containing protein [Gammaproteobacteria bacterium]
MITVKHTVFAVTLLVWVTGLSAAVYKSVDAQGNVVYTDEPAGNGKPLVLPPLSTIPAPKYTTGKPSVKPGDSGNAYTNISIVSPTQEATLRDNTGAVPVTAGLKPVLNAAAGHRFQFYLDGQTQGKPTESSHIVIANVDRGAHNVAVAVVDAEGKEVMRSSPVEFNLHRQSINFPRGPGAPAPAPRGR